MQLRKTLSKHLISNEAWGRCGSLGFQTAAEKPDLRCAVDDVRVAVWELIFYILPRMFGLFVKGDVDWVDVTTCVDNAIVGVSVYICDKSEGGLRFELHVTYIWLGGFWN